MQHFSIRHTACNDTMLHAEAWLPTESPTAAILMIHGIAEHIGRYAHVGAFFAEQGYAVFGYDQRGHGKSGGSRCYFENADLPIDDFEQMLAWVQEEVPDKSVFLLGHSMGSIITLMYLLRGQPSDCIAGCILTGTPLHIDKNVPQFVLSAGRVLNHFVPALPLTSVDVTGMSRDPAVLATWTADPLASLTFIRVRTALALVGMARHIRANLADITLPVLILHGGSDRIAAPSGSVELHENIRSTDKKLKLYSDLFHEILNEPERNMILDDVLKWIKKHALP